MGEGGARRLLDLGAARLAGAIGDIAGHGVGEQRRLLRHDGEARAERLEIGLLHRDAVDRHAAGLRIVEAEQKREYRGLARA